MKKSKIKSQNDNAKFKISSFILHFNMSFLFLKFAF